MHVFEKVASESIQKQVYFRGSPFACVQKSAQLLSIGDNTKYAKTRVFSRVSPCGRILCVVKIHVFEKVLQARLVLLRKLESTLSLWEQPNLKAYCLFSGRLCCLNDWGGNSLWDPPQQKFTPSRATLGQTR